MISTPAAEDENVPQSDANDATSSMPFSCNNVGHTNDKSDSPVLATDAIPENRERSF